MISEILKLLLGLLLLYPCMGLIGYIFHFIFNIPDLIYSKRRKNIDEKINLVKKKYPYTFDEIVRANNINLWSSSEKIFKLKKITKHSDDYFIEKEREHQYRIIEYYYKDGLERWLQLNKTKDKKVIIKNKSKIEEYDKLIKHVKKIDNWEAEQRDFSDKCHSLSKNILTKYDKSSYNIQFSRKNVNDEVINANYKIWQFYVNAYCFENDLDYTDFKHIEFITEVIEKVKINNIGYKPEVYQEILILIKNLCYLYKNISVYFCVNNIKKYSKWWFYNYDSIKNILTNNTFGNIEICNPIESVYDYILDEVDVSLIDYNYYPYLEHRHIVIIDMQTNNAQMRKVCENIIEKNKDKMPLITYISMFKGYEREEMQHLIFEKKKEKIEEERLKKELDKYKIDKNEIVNLLTYNKINCFYHFTALENIEYIKKHGGLYSWWTLKQKGINVPFIGGEGGPSQKLDMKYGLQDYVRLSFCDDHPMQYRHMQNGVRLVLLKISTDVATWKDTLFSDINATDNNHNCGGTINDLQRVDFRSVKRNFVKKDDSDFKSHQAEVLVKTYIPIKYIMNIDSPYII